MLGNKLVLEVARGIHLHWLVEFFSTLLVLIEEDAVHTLEQVACGWLQLKGNGWDRLQGGVVAYQLRRLCCLLKMRLVVRILHPLRWMGRSSHGFQQI